MLRGYVRACELRGSRVRCYTEQLVTAPWCVGSKLVKLIVDWGSGG